MTRESTGPDVVDFAAYRAARENKTRIRDDEIITDIHFSVTRGGKVIPSSMRVAELHVLAVLSWCLDMSSNMLDAYLVAAP
jgi:hypothetical protein